MTKTALKNKIALDETQASLNEINENIQKIIGLLPYSEYVKIQDEIFKISGLAGKLNAQIHNLDFQAWNNGYNEGKAECRGIN